MPRSKRGPVLEVADLVLRRGQTLILDRVNWRIEPNQHWTILGPNGSGKTSLLSALTGYLTPTHGTIAVLQKRYGHTDWRDLRRQIGLVSSSLRQMMPQAEPAIETIVSGKYAMIDLWGKIGPGDRARALRILKQIECSHLAERPWQFLSQGERQRVLIGRALMADPPVLLLDEPCAGLDPAAREHFLDFLQRLAHRVGAPTLVLVTHHVEEIVPAFSHLLVLKSGRVLASGTKGSTLTSSVLSEAFDTPVRLIRRSTRYSMVVASKKNKIL